MIFNDAIHVQIEGGKNNNVEGINNPKTNNYLCALLDAW